MKGGGHLLLSVIIPTCHRNDLLAKCLDCLAPGKQTGDVCVEARGQRSGGGSQNSEVSGQSSVVSRQCPMFTYEVIVTDDGSKSTAREMVEKNFPWARWIEGPRRGPAANRNNGAKHAQGKWLVFTDDDCLPDQGFLSGYYHAVLENKAEVLEGKTSPSGIRTRVDMECPANETGGYLWSCNMAVQKDLFWEMEGFDENFPGPAMEDMDFRIRLVKRKKQIPFIPRALVLHPWRTGKSFKDIKMVNASIVYYVGKHSELKCNFSLGHLSLGLARRLFSHLPRAAFECKGRGWIRESLSSVYSTWTLFRAIKSSKQ